MLTHRSDDDNEAATLMSTLAVVLSLALACTAAMAEEGSCSRATASETEAIRALFADYARLMNDKDAEQIARRIYSVPVLCHLPTGEHIGYTDAGALAQT